MCKILNVIFISCCCQADGRIFLQWQYACNWNGNVF